MSPLRLLSAAIIALAAASLPAQDRPKVAVAAEDEGAPLFNGKDLAGWVNVNCHPDTFFVKDGEIVTTGNPTGFLRTEKQYENFVLDFDWMHVEKEKMANSGLFVWGDPLPATGTPYTRGIEVQVLINYAPKDGWATSHGDIFSIHGARCKPDRPHPRGIERCLPSENRVKGAGEWNHYKVIANDGAIKLHVNGKEVSGVSQCTPRKGYLALESEGSECHFKNIRLKELPSTNPKPEETARVWEGHVNLFNGLDLKGWKTEEGAWKAGGGILKRIARQQLVTETPYTTGELIFDWRIPKASKGNCAVGLRGVSVIVSETGEGTIVWSESGAIQGKEFSAEKAVKVGGWNRTVLKLDEKAVGVQINDKAVANLEVAKTTATPCVRLFGTAEGLENMNVFFREAKEKK